MKKTILKGMACGLVAVMFLMPVNIVATKEYSTTFTGSTILIVVNESIYQGIKESLTTFEEDLINEGYQVEKEMVGEDASPPDIRGLLQYYYDEYGLKGAILVGNIPAAYAEIHTGCGDPNALKIWISLDAFDMYYMDLDGKWDHVENPDFCEDAPSKVVECHTRDSCETFKDEYVVYMNEEEREWDYTYPQQYWYIENKEQYKAEIWIARIMAHNLDIPGKNEVDIVNEFFEWNHMYRTGNCTVSDTVYLCDAINDPIIDHGMDFSNIFTNIIRKPHITKDEYITYLEDPEGSKLIYLLAHSWPQGHMLFDRKYLTVDELIHLKKNSVFYMLNACSSCRWDQYISSPHNPNYLGGLYVFDKTENEGDYGLGAIGFTGVGGFNNLKFFTDYINFHENPIYGDTWKYYFNHNLMRIFQPWNYVFLGDPTIRPQVAGNHPPNTPGKPSGPTSGKVGESYTYTTLTADPDGDDIKYGWDWDGDKVVDEWTSLYDSGETIEASHTWDEQGTYEIRVKAQDEIGLESEWSDPLVISMPKFHQNPIVMLLEKLNDWVRQLFGRDIAPLFFNI